MYLGQIEFAELLISHGANVHMPDENRNIPLFLAVEDCNYALFSFAFHII